MAHLRHSCIRRANFFFITDTLFLLDSFDIGGDGLLQFSSTLRTILIHMALQELPQEKKSGGSNIVNASPIWVCDACVYCMWSCSILV